MSSSRPSVTPVVRELDLPGIDAATAFAVLADEARHAAIFETPGATYVVHAVREVLIGDDVLDRVQERVVDVVEDVGVPLPEFVGGALVVLTHEFAQVLEPSVTAAHLGPELRADVPTAAAFVVDQLVAFHDGRISVIALADGDAVTLELAEARVADAAALLLAGAPGAHRSGVTTPLPGRPVRAASSPTAPEFEALVDAAIEEIRRGEVVQVVLSRRFERAFAGDPLELHRTLREHAPSPYHLLVRMGDVHVVGASPEQLVGVAGSRVTTHPIAGTRPRGVDAADDELLERDLVSCRKERAEHMMLVDLGRNDLARVCHPGSVDVRELARVERYARVMHLVSRVDGELADGLHPVDALRACFPAGTLTGAPKVRAMQLIAQFEPTERGVYGGIVGLVGHGRFLDSAITIRTAVLADGRAVVQAGAGIVAASKPAAERAETEHKAQVVLEAIAAVHDASAVLRPVQQGVA